MQIFELHFNPKLKEDRFFDSFIYEPTHSNEKKLGSLYIIGELNNALPSNLKFLDNLAQTLKDNYYKLIYKSPEKALSEDLKKTNEFLSREIKKENVSWLGNLNFVVFSVKDFDLTFTKTGDIKVLLIRQGRIIDVGKNLDLQDIEPYPLKVFFSVVSGKLTKDDIILVLTKDVFNFFIKQNILDKISQAKEINKKTLKEILPPSLFTKEEGAKISGICFLTILNKQIRPQEEMVFQNFQKSGFFTTLRNKKNDFSFLKVIWPLTEIFEKSKIISVFKKPLKFLKESNSYFSKLKNKNFLSKIFFLVLKSKKIKKSSKELNIQKKEIKKSKIKLPVSFLAKSSIKPISTNLKFGVKIKNQLVFVFVLIVVLLIGFLIFKGNEQRKENKIKIPLNQIEEKFNLAKSYLILENEEQANSLLKEAWLEIASLTEQKTKLKSKIFSLKKSIEQELKELNKLEEIENPQLVLEINIEKIGFIPKNILFSNFKFYLFNAELPKLYILDLEKEEKIILKTDKNLDFGSISSYLTLFFSKPNTLLYLKNNIWQEKIVEMDNFNFDLFFPYLANLYFLDKEKCEIIKYPYLQNFQWSSPKKWTKNNNKTCNPKEATIDGSIWILNTDNSINRYHSGDYQESVKLDLFPIIENITKIKTNYDTPYLYLLEPINNRLIIIDKETKEIIKQFQSQKFNNLNDFTISKDGKTIHILNDNKVYKIEI